MPVPIHRRMTSWFLDHLLWDTAGSSQQGFFGALWATRKLLIAVAAATLLTWREWVEHHPPEIVIVALIHFVFVFAVIALVVYIAGRLSGNKSAGGQPTP